MLGVEVIKIETFPIFNTCAPDTATYYCTVTVSCHVRALLITEFAACAYACVIATYILIFIVFGVLFVN